MRSEKCGNNQQYTSDGRSYDQTILHAIEKAKIIAKPSGPRMSVVCSVYNGEKHLGRAFESIKRLEYDTLRSLCRMLLRQIVRLK